VKIPLPDLMRMLREQQMERGLRPWQERLVLKIWAWAALFPAVYSVFTRIAARILNWIAGEEKLLHYLPGGQGWTGGRDLPAPEGQTFRELYRHRIR